MAFASQLNALSVASGMEGTEQRLKLLTKSCYRLVAAGAGHSKGKRPEN